MYEIAPAVEAGLREGARVDVGWAVAVNGFSARDWGEAVTVTPDGRRVGSVLSGSLDEQLAELSARGVTGRRVRLRVSEADAQVSGLSCGGDAQCLLVSAADLPDRLWGLLRGREPLCLVTRLAGDDVVATTLHTADDIEAAGPAAADLFRRGRSAVLLTESEAVTVLAPVPTLLVVGGGAIADSLVTMAELLGWRPQVVSGADVAAEAVAGLAAVDKLVVLSHDDDLAGAVLEAALAGPVGYIGALGSRRTQQSRADWLAARGVTQLSRVHGPAGLDIGSRTAAEIAVSIVAEALAVAAGRHLVAAEGSPP